MTTILEPIDPKLRALLREESTEPFASAEMRTRIQAATFASVSGSGSGSGSDLHRLDGEMGGVDTANAAVRSDVGSHVGNALQSVLLAPLGSAAGATALVITLATGLVIGTVLPNISPTHRPAMSADAGAEASANAGTEASDDAGTEASDDAGTEASDDAGTEASDDAGTEASDDAGTEASDDAGTETSAGSRSRTDTEQNGGAHPHSRRRSEIEHLPPRPSDHERPRSRTLLSTEQALLDRARMALARGFHKDALEAIRAYQHAFPRGELRAECAGLHVIALHRSGALEDAKAEAKAYLLQYPDGLMAERVRAVLEERQGRNDER